jgi:hypothetical protein
MAIFFKRISNNSLDRQGERGNNVFDKTRSKGRKLMKNHRRVRFLSGFSPRISDFTIFHCLLRVLSYDN